MNKNKDDLVRLKKFIMLSNVYYNRLMLGMSVNNLISGLDTEEYIYKYNKEFNNKDLKKYTGFIENDEDIEDNWCALAKAVYEFNNYKIGENKVIDKYILKMLKR